MLNQHSQENHQPEGPERTKNNYQRQKALNIFCRHLVSQSHFYTQSMLWGYSCTNSHVTKGSNESKMWRCSPHAPQELKENQILSVQDRYDDEEHSHQKAEEEHHCLDDHACRGKIKAIRPHGFTPCPVSNKSIQHNLVPLMSHWEERL